MACNCGTKEEIDKLYKAYGDKLHNTDNLSLWDKIRKAWYTFLTILTWCLVLPFMFVFILVFLFWSEDRKINVQKFNLLRIFHLKPANIDDRK